MITKSHRKSHNGLSLLGLMLLIFATGQALSADQQGAPQKLFTSVVAANSTSSLHGVSHAMALGETAVASVQASTVDDTNDTIQIELLPGVTVVAQKLRAVTKRDGEIAWYGQVESKQRRRGNSASEIPVDALNSVVLVRRGDRVAGMVQVDGDIYEIQSPQAGETLITRIEPDKLPQDNGPDYRDAPAEAQTKAEPATGIRSTHSTIDVMFAITDQAKALIGDRVAQQLLIDGGLAYVNQANINSRADITFENVGILDVPGYQEHSTFDEMLDDLEDGNHALLGKPAAAFRSAHYADLVVLVVANRSLCGKAWRMPKPSAEYAFSAVDQGCVLSSYTIGHEMAHNFGASHDLAQYGGKPKNSPVWGHGIQHTTGLEHWRDIMAYACSPTKCSKILAWSNPDVTYLGDPMGTEEYENVARVLNEQRERIANFYVRPGVTHPKAVAIAKPDTVEGGATVTLDGSGSSSPDGSALSYEWVQASGYPAITIERSSHAVASITAPALDQTGTFDFELIVTTTKGQSDSQQVKVTVQASPPPEGPPITATLHVPSSVIVGDVLPVSVDARSSTDKPLSYAWHYTSDYLSGDIGDEPSGHYTALEAGAGKTANVYVVISDGTHSLTPPMQAVTITARPSGPPCHPAWSASTVYPAITNTNPAALVSHDARNYEQQFWTQGNNPTTNNGVGKAWKDLGPCH